MEFSTNWVDILLTFIVVLKINNGLSVPIETIKEMLNSLLTEERTKTCELYILQSPHVAIAMLITAS